MAFGASFLFDSERAAKHASVRDDHTRTVEYFTAGQLATHEHGKSEGRRQDAEGTLRTKDVRAALGLDVLDL